MGTLLLFHDIVGLWNIYLKGKAEDLVWLIDRYDIRCLVVMWAGGGSCAGIV